MPCSRLQNSTFFALGDFPTVIHLLSVLTLVDNFFVSSALSTQRL
jgi:hypothetical protein